MITREAFIGMELPALRIDPISRKLLALFAGASGNHRPSHIDIDAARAKGYDDVFAHGMLSMAFLERVLTNWVPQQRVRSFKVRFLARVPVHAEPICTGKIIALKDGLATVEVSLSLDGGKVIAVRGEATIDIG
jgi:hydroxyacyl-ACP dehydratase HTD2-like protein with hotdog domain